MDDGRLNILGTYLIGQHSKGVQERYRKISFQELQEHDFIAINPALNHHPGINARYGFRRNGPGNDKLLVLDKVNILIKSFKRSIYRYFIIRG